MFKRLEQEARELCAKCEWVSDCSMCSDMGVDFNPYTCKVWKWYLPYPFCIPAKIMMRIRLVIS